MPTNTVIPPQTGAPSAPDAQTSKLEHWLARPLGDPDPKRFGSGVGFLLGWWVTWRNTGCTAHVTASGRGGRFTRCRELDWLAGSRLHLVDVEMTRAAVLLPIFGSVSSRRRSCLARADRRPCDAQSREPAIPDALDRAGTRKAALHHWHHSVEPPDRNFAVHFPWIDRLFGTFHLPGDAWPERLGTRGDPVPAGYLGQLVYPLRQASAAAR